MSVNVPETIGGPRGIPPVRGELNEESVYVPERSGGGFPPGPMGSSSSSLHAVNASAAINNGAYNHRLRFFMCSPLGLPVSDQRSGVSWPRIRSRSARNSERSDQFGQSVACANR